MLVSLQGPKGLQAYKVSEWFKVNKVSNPKIENLLAYTSFRPIICFSPNMSTDRLL